MTDPIKVRAEVMHTGALSYMLNMQGELQRRFTGLERLPSELTDAEKMDYIRTMHTAIIKELGEVMDECGWKPWASSNHINVEAFKSELVDVWHFFMNFMLVVGMTADDLIGGYVAKNHRNHERQDEGYDGVTDKCPGCHRALDDAGVRCYKGSPVNPPWREIVWCNDKGKWFEIDGTITAEVPPL
jgi:dimeric dUTPase (all-alpha-NTP-PPase superfamily)